MGKLAGNRPRYVAVWRVLLGEWLGWSDARFAEWVAQFDDDLDDRGFSLFYHEDELYHVLHQLIPPELAQRVVWGQSVPNSNALSGVVGELWLAVTGRHHGAEWGSPAFDWQAARERVDAALKRHGSFPGEGSHA